MRRVFLATLAVSLVAPLEAHRLDEDLQATLISVTGGRATLEVNLTPGVIVADRVLRLIDTDLDGRISPQEELAYANRLLGDLSLTVGKKSASLELVDTEFPPPDEIRAGLGKICLRFRAELPPIEQ